jgi:hypothetical protein
MHGRRLIAVLATLLAVGQATDGLARPDPPEDEEIETDRDSFTPATSLAPESRWIFESAYSFIDNRRVAETHSFPELVTRYGVSDWLELRLGWNYEVGGAPNTVSGNVSDSDEDEGTEIERDSQMFYGFKAALTSQDGWRPQSALIVQAGTPTTGKETATQLFSTYVFGWKLANDWKWDTSMRYGSDTAEGDRYNVWAPSSVVKIPIGEHWAAHAEYFGITTAGAVSDRSQHYFSPGVHYLVTPGLEVGVRVGWGLNDDSARQFANVGVGWQY